MPATGQQHGKRSIERAWCIFGKDSVCGKETSLHDYGRVSPVALFQDLVSETTISTLTTLQTHLGEDDDTRFKHAMKLPIENPSRPSIEVAFTGFF